MKAEIGCVDPFAAQGLRKDAAVAGLVRRWRERPPRYYEIPTARSDRYGVAADEIPVHRGRRTGRDTQSETRRGVLRRSHARNAWFAIRRWACKGRPVKVTRYHPPIQRLQEEFAA
jgi:hypothetical protein